jgi:hypothetical protein
MDTIAYRISNFTCHQIPFSFSPCSTSDARLLLGYCVILAAIAAVITGFFYMSNRPTGR